MCSVHIHSDRHTSTLYPPSRALSITLNDRYSVLHAWPHLFLPCQSDFPRLFADLTPARHSFHTVRSIRSTYTPYIRRDPDEADSGGIDECVMWAVSEAATYPPYVFSSSIRSTSFPFPCPECIPYFLVLLLHSGCEPSESLTYHTKLTTPYPVNDKNNITNREIRLNLPWNAVSRALGNQIQTCCFCLLFVVCCSVSSAWIFPFWSITITNLAAAHDHHAGRHAGWHHGVALSME